MNDKTDIVQGVTRRLQEAGDAWPAALSDVLEMVLADVDCVTGTIHRLDPGTGRLHVLAYKGIPEAILDRVRDIPIGKGMAGMAAERRAPVQVCNLQEDQSGVVRPGAKLTEMEGAVACPMLVEGELCGTIGVAKPTPYEFTDAEMQRLTGVAEAIGRVIRGTADR